MHSQPTRNWELEGGDAKIFFSEMEASVSWEKKLKLEARSCRDEGGRGQATGGIGTAGRETASGVEGAMGVARRWWCLLLCVFSLSITLLLRFASQVSSIRNTTSSLNTYLGFEPSPEPEPSTLVLVVKVSLSLVKLPSYPRASLRIALFYTSVLWLSVH